MMGRSLSFLLEAFLPREARFPDEKFWKKSGEPIHGNKRSPGHRQGTTAQDYGVGRAHARSIPLHVTDLKAAEEFPAVSVKPTGTNERGSKVFDIIGPEEEVSRFLSTIGFTQDVITKMIG